MLWNFCEFINIIYIIFMLLQSMSAKDPVLLVACGSICTSGMWSGQRHLCVLGLAGIIRLSLITAGDIAV